MAAHQIIGIDIDGLYARLGKVSGQKLTACHQYKISRQSGQDKIIKELIQHIEGIFNSQVAGIGIGVPSIVDVHAGIVYEVKRIPSWKEVHLKDKLEKHFKVPVYVNNDANCFAAGEKYFGKGIKYNNVVGLILGEGMGAGVIVENKLYSGINCGVGEFGKMPYRDRDFEYYCSAQFFTNEVGSPFETIYQLAMKGNSRARQHFKNLGLYLSDAVKSIVCAVDPQIIILGGQVAQAYPLIRNTLKKGLQSFVFQRSIHNLEIKVSDKANIAILGAAALYYDAMESRKIEDLEAQRKTAENESLWRAKQANLLYEVGQRVTYSLDLDVILKDVVTTVCDAFNFYGVMLLLLDADEKMLHLKAIAGGYSKIFPKDLALKVGEGMIGTAAQTHKVEVSNDVRKNPHYIQKADELTLSELAVPILSGKKVIGILDMQSDRTNAFNESDIESAWTLTTQIATAIENAKLYQQAQQEIQERREVEKELRKSRNSLQKAKKETDNILLNVEEGLFLLNSKFEFGTEYSKALEKIFNEDDLARKNLLEILKSKIPESSLTDVTRFLELLFDPNVDEISVNELNPLANVEMSFKLSDHLLTEIKYLSFKFRRIVTEDQVSELIVTVEDNTEQVQLANKLTESEAQSKKRMEWLINILHVEPDLLREFIESARSELSTIIDVMRNAEQENSYRKVLEKIYRSVHMIKGNASLLDLTFFASTAHETEDLISKILEKKEILGRDFISLNMKIDEIQSSLREINSLIEKMSRIQSHFRPKRSYESEKMLNSIKNYIQNISAELNKKVNLVHEQFDGTSIPHIFKILVKDIIIQLARNSVHHGIETVEDRLSLQKPESGTIEIQSRLNDNSFEFCYRDDGRGLQFDKIIQKAKASGKWDSGEIESWKQSRIAELIFEPGISTSEQVDMLAGRGMGLNIVKDKVEKHHGQILIESVPGKLLEFKITLPLNQNQQ